ncbi:hypothetical protein [Leifsonia sp. LS1]|uniref:hypothetical protein n=1 Tax=Leifsonia sp. LS1 TaxID=2828483 RepID=UPI001CFEE5DE|nr:hypothetical protein [Leifsonia sp. LS1]
MGQDDRISPRRFHDADGVDGWSVLFDGAVARFATGSFDRGAALVAAGGRLTDHTREPHWRSLADPEGNVADIAAWRDDPEEDDL